MAPRKLWWDTDAPLTEEQSRRLTLEIFLDAENNWPDLMEPWSNLVAESVDPAEQQKIMQQGLAATFRQRYPMPERFWTPEQKPRRDL